MRTPKKYLKWSFLLLPTCIKGTLVILNSTTQPARHRKCERLPRIATHKFFDFYIKKHDLTNLFDQFPSTVLFSISFSNLSCNLCLRYYVQLVQFDKEIRANLYHHSLWEYSKRFQCLVGGHLTPHMTLSIETCIKWTPYQADTLY